MASKRELQALIVLAGKVDPSLRKALQSAEKGTQRITRETGILGNVMSRTWGLAKTAVTGGVVAIGTAMAAVATKGIMLASDLQEVQNVVDVTFGQNATKINQWAKTAKNGFGLSELAAKQYSSTIGAILKSSGLANNQILEMSEGMASLAGDFASFYNVSQDAAFEKIRSGLTGETEPLMAWGINMQVAALEAYALSKGIKTSFDKMNEADKAILRYNYLLERSKDAQGDFARTSNSFANQLRLIKTNAGETAAKIMNSTLPAFTKLFQQGNQLMSKFGGDQAQIERISNKVAGAVEKGIALIPAATQAIRSFANGVWDAGNAAYRIYSFMSDHWTLIKPLIYGIVGAMLVWKGTLGAIALYEMVTKAATLATEVFSIAKWKDAAATTYLHILYAKDAIMKGISTAATWAGTAATWAATAATTAFGAVLAFITSPIGIVVLAIGALIAGAVLLYQHWDTVSAFLANSWEAIKSAFVVGVNFIVDKLNWLIKKINKVKIPGMKIPLIPTIGEETVSQSVSSMDQYASGGFASRPSIFGEAGPEAAIPLKRTPRSLGLLNQTAQALGVSPAGGGPTFVYAPNIPGGGNADGIRAMILSGFEDFKAMCEEWWESKRRENFD
ncbi:hypothetical protein [Gorillibacterium sp. sgz5001074]|uniref:hypothetical protein n=1 Tax=Gorillibacterium sp. sgz5001074 TaxID=3446695 RepID=UPI003F663C68